MRYISTYEYEQLQKKLEKIEETLSSEDCDEIIRQNFSLDEIQLVRQDLEAIYRKYFKQLSGLEEFISEYHHMHNDVASKLRVRFRILNKNLANNVVSRRMLGLPPYKPGRIKV